MNDDGYLLLAVADDMLATFEHDDEADINGVYDWLIAKAHEVGAVPTSEGQQA